MSPFNFRSISIFFLMFSLYLTFSSSCRFCILSKNLHLNKTLKSILHCSMMRSKTDIHVCKDILLIFLVQWCQCYTSPLSDWGICCASHDFFLHHLQPSVVLSSDPPKQFDSLCDPNTKSHYIYIHRKINLHLTHCMTFSIYDRNNSQAFNDSRKFIRIWRFGGFHNDILLLSLSMLSDRSFSFHFFFTQSLQGHVRFFLGQLLFLLYQVILCQQKFSSLNFNFCKLIPIN